MRPFAKMVMELLAIPVPGLEEIVLGKTSKFEEGRDPGDSKAKLLQMWDDTTEQINVLWHKIPLERFQEHVKLFGQYEGTVQSHICYFIDNEIHHRGQGYVYLRSLGVEPPLFYDRQ